MHKNSTIIKWLEKHKHNPKLLIKQDKIQEIKI